MNWRRLTGLMLVVLVVVLAIYDMVAFAVGGVDSTISRVVLGVAHNNPIIPFAAGVLCGHFFAPQPPPE